MVASHHQNLTDYCHAQLAQRNDDKAFAAGGYHIIEPHSAYSEEDHHEVLTSLVRSGVISDYRYIDASPQPALIAIQH